MVVAIALQLLGVALVATASFLVFGAVGPLVVVGVVAFVAGLFAEQGRR